MTKIKNTKKGMAKKTLSMSLVVAMLATSNVPVWAAEFSDGTDATAFTSEAEAPVVDDTTDAIVDNAQDAVATISVVGATNNKISVNAARNMIVNTNWNVTSGEKACINIFVPRSDSFAGIRVGMKNKDITKECDEGFTKPKSSGSLDKTTVNWNKIIPADCIGKTVYVAVTETINAGGDSEVKAVTSVTITADQAQDYVKSEFSNGPVVWGSVLNSYTYVPGVTFVSGITADGFKWVSQSTEQADGYTTTSSDAGKIYELRATLKKGDTVLGEARLGSVQVTNKTADLRGAKYTWEDGVKTDENGNPTYTYDGTEHNPKLKSVKLADGTVLNVANETYKTTSNAYLTSEQKTNATATDGIDYIVSFDTADYGTINVPAKLKIAKYDLKDATLTVSKGFEYNKSGYTVGTPDALEKAGISLKDKNGKDLELGTLADTANGYSVAVNAPTNSVGSENAYVTVTAGNSNKNYKGSISVYAPITQCELKDGDVNFADDVDNLVYNGRAYEPKVTVKGGTLVKDVDYTVSYANNTQAGKATVTVTGKGNFKGTVTKEFEIKSASLEDLKRAINRELKNETYTGKAITPIKPAYNDMQYVLGRDFNVEYLPQNVNAGEVRVKLTGIGNYKDAKPVDDIYFTINARSLKDKDVKVEMKGLTYSKDMTDAQIENAVTVTYNGMTLVKDTDYKISVNKTNLATTGKVQVTITGTNGNYKDIRTESLAVTAKDINTVTLPKIEAQKYSGNAFTVNEGKLQDGSTPVADFVLMDGTNKLKINEDYKIAGYENNKNVGTATINIVGINGYTGKASISFPIVEKELNATIMYKAANGLTTVIEDKPYNYTTANSSKGYTFTFAANTTTNGALVVVDEKGNAVAPANYTVTYADNKAAGTATITVEGKGGYKLNAVNTFKIVPAKLSDKVTPTGKTATDVATIVKTGKTYNYTGEAIEAELSFEAKDGEYKLVKDVDYKIEYSDNVNAGDAAKVKLVGLGNYAGAVTETSDLNKISGTFTIAKTEIRNTDILASDVPYAGGITVAPKITIKNQYSNKELVEGTDYTVEVTKGGANVGQAEAKIKLTSAAANNYSLVGGTEYTVRFNVASLDLSKATVSPIADQTATGEQIKPAITVMNGSVKLVEGKDYEVSYGENKEVGEGTVTIKALSSNKNYTGSQTVKFNIVKETPAVGQAMISEVRVSGNTVTPVLSGDVDGAVGYDYVIATEEDTQNGRVYISKNVLKTNTNFYYVQEGTYYAYCHAWTRDENGKKVFGEWSNIKKFTVDATTPSKPSIKSVKVKGHTVTVTFTASEDAKGYDVVLGEAVKKVNGENRPVEYGKLVVKNIEDGVYTATFYNVPDGKYYAGVHSYNKSSNDGKKVFSKWGYRKTAISVGKAN